MQDRKANARHFKIELDDVIKAGIAAVLALIVIAPVVEAIVRHGH